MALTVVPQRRQQNLSEVPGETNPRDDDDHDLDEDATDVRRAGFSGRSEDTYTASSNFRQRRSLSVTPPSDDNDNDDEQHSSGSDFCLQIPSVVCDAALFIWDWSNAAVEVWLELLTAAPPFHTATLHRVSIILLGVEKLKDSMARYHQQFLHALVKTANGIHKQTDGIIVVQDQNFVIPPWMIWWGVPCFVGVLSMSFILMLQLSWGQQEEAVIATALIALVFLEALLPLFILGCTSMFLFQQVSWETGLLLLVVVWLGSTFSAHCIRRMLYQSLGHG